jgi:hypothetical protein
VINQKSRGKNDIGSFVDFFGKGFRHGIFLIAKQKEGVFELSNAQKLTSKNAKEKKVGRWVGGSGI